MIQVIACNHFLELFGACTALLPFTAAETQAGRRDQCHISEEPAKSLLAASCEASSGRNRGGCCCIQASVILIIIIVIISLCGLCRRLGYLFHYYWGKRPAQDCRTRIRVE